jgi:hypothetical protein
MKERFDECSGEFKPMRGKMKHEVIKCEICHNHSYAALYLKSLEIAIRLQGMDEETKKSIFMEAQNILEEQPK